MSPDPFISRRRQRSRRPQFDPEALFPAPSRWSPTAFYRGLRSAGRILALFAWGTFSGWAQALFQILPGWMHIRMPVIFWKGVCRILNIEVRVLGTTPAATTPGLKQRPVLFAANHSTWLDIATLGSILPTLFIGKQEISTWPLIGSLTKVGGTIFISRNRQTAEKEVQFLIKRLQKGYNIAFFPEGTSSDGTGVLPFRASLFTLAKPRARKGIMPDHPIPLVQPISVAYDRLEGLPTGRNRRISVFSWFGDMELVPHIWNLGKWRSMRATIVLHPPIDPKDYPSRKSLAEATHAIIRKGNEDINQQRYEHGVLAETR
ncbi:lysophospholipid acyltransferase family protein [Oecophyllibacter saccharovorans]|uniref:lysophospholipid acyltransferase family protein n=1 Tax=Oecophyllibacter saccharovorans TaxID=2558360 RepID=UPI0011693069|nr:lysophospholipid acyltransferase family protein [Oecophyllibacter saccharovorans]TPW34745.1 1-acyl-sn-glycerol-3-phosphate acyltransferase [Oecophyllibacter saccharovorans]